MGKRGSRGRTLRSSALGAGRAPHRLSAPPALDAGVQGGRSESARLESWTRDRPAQSGGGSGRGAGAARGDASALSALLRGGGDWSFICWEKEEVDLQDLPSATIACHLDPRVFVDGLCGVYGSQFLFLMKLKLTLISPMSG
ncbi:calcipressin-1-like [Sciurus carolinensis]|uniref:calcipressin-1-like n=1 Tax=Sciurus carolinensis TaxID=30640 RepID=UPI001FB44998|nr:calcipressin-1-like [Sciurus carolinensis]